jgi:hypothetical protein
VDEQDPLALGLLLAQDVEERLQPRPRRFRLVVGLGSGRRAFEAERVA